jgi:3-hydroxyisobutyrate dehydrogenase-like beta-hydroxyacid dehydrogenase
MSAVPQPVGVVGLGAMGAPVVGHLVTAGVAVRVVDRSAQTLAEVVATTGAQADSTLAELAARCPTVLVMVADDAAVRQVVAELTQQRTALRNVVVCSSVHPATVREVAETASMAGVGLLDAAMIGGIRGVTAGTLALLVGGDRATLAGVRPVLEPWTAAIHHLGPVGAGQVAKSANNLIHWAQVCALEEAFRLVAAAGLSVPAVRRALADGPVDSRALHELEQMRLTWWRKDLEAYRRLADELGTARAVADLCAAAMPSITVESLAELLRSRPSS